MRLLFNVNLKESSDRSDFSLLIVGITVPASFCPPALPLGRSIFRRIRAPPDTKKRNYDESDRKGYPSGENGGQKAIS